MDPEIVSSPEDDNPDLSPEDQPEPPVVKPKPDKVPYTSYKHQKDEKERLQRRLNELEAKENERNSANQTETQRLQAQLDRVMSELNEAKTNLKATRVDRQVELTARELNFRDPEDALHLVRSKLEVDDEGNVANAEDLLTQLAKNKPYLLSTKEEPAPKAAAPKAPPAKGGTPANPPSTLKQLSRKDLSSMKPADIMERFKKGELDDLIKVSSQ